MRPSTRPTPAHRNRGGRPGACKAGCRTFFVRSISERLRLSAAPAATICVLNGLIGTASTNALLTWSVLGSREEIDEWSGFLRARCGCRPSVAGFEHAPARAADRGGPRASGRQPPRRISRRYPVAAVRRLEDFGRPANARQIEAFDAVQRAIFSRLPITNSSSVYLPSGPHHDMVRPRLRPLWRRQSDAPVGQPDAPPSCVSRRGSCRCTVEDGETIQLAANGRPRGRRRVAALSVGRRLPARREPHRTQDGVGAWPRARRSSQGSMPFAGRVSMDLIALDVTGIPAERIGRGARLVTLIGDDLTLDEVASRAGTIGYEILTSLGRRYAASMSETPADGETRFPPSSARAAAPSTAAGRTSARRAAAETRSSRRPAPRPPRWSGRRRQGPLAPRGACFPQGMTGEAGSAAHALRHRGARSRARQAASCAVGDPARRRAGHRQVDARAAARR